MNADLVKKRSHPQGTLKKRCIKMHPTWLAVPPARLLASIEYLRIIDPVTSLGIHRTPEFHPMWLSVRPARVATFIPVIPDWGFHCVRKSLEILTRTWGGAADILIPLGKDLIIPECFWRIIKAFDADRYAIYCPTFRDFEEAAPADFAKHCENEVAAMVKSGIEPSLAQERVGSEQYLDDQLWNLDLPDQIKERLIRELSPTDGEGPFHVDWFKHDNGPFYGLTDMASFATLDREALTALDLSDLDDLTSVLVADRVGLIGKSYEAVLKAHGRVINNHKVDPSHISQILELVCRGYAEPANRDLERRIAERLEKAPSEEPPWSSNKHTNRFPLNRTAFACDWRIGPIEMAYKQPIVIVVGDSVDDYCLASSLHRVTGRAVWIPKSLVTDEIAARKIWRHLLLELRRSNRDRFEDKAIVFSSLSLGQSDIDSLLGIAEASLPDFQRPAFKTVEPNDIPIPARRRLFHKSLNGLVKYEPFIEGEMVATVETPIPRDCAEHEPQAVTWYVDVSIKNQQLPTRSCLNGLVSPTKGYGVRCSSSGISYLSQSIFTYSGGRIEDNTQRPRLRCPAPTEVFQTLLARDGHRAELSSAGKYLVACINRFGSLDAFAQVLKDPKLNLLLTSYISNGHTSEDKKGAKAPVFLSDRTYMTIEGVASVIQSSVMEARQLVDDWMGRGVLSRGLVLKCPECRFAGWYPIADISETFRCIRCHDSSRIVQETWKEPAGEPWWYYEMAEVVYQAVKGNCRAPVLALSLLSQKARSYIYTPELDVFFADKGKTELDLWTLINGRMIVGEATKDSQLSNTKKSELARLADRRRVTDALTADEIVFATTAEQWQSPTKQRINTAFQDSRAKVRFIEGLGTASERLS